MSLDTSGIYNETFKDERYNPAEPDRIEFVRNWLESSHNKPKKILDVGCGRGHYLNALRPKYNVTGLEPSNAADGIENVYKADILSAPNLYYNALYCMDVLEHIPPDDLHINLTKLSQMSRKALLGIANHSDVWNGVELHLIQENSEWWEQTLRRYYKQVTILKRGKRYYIFECLR